MAGGEVRRRVAECVQGSADQLGALRAVIRPTRARSGRRRALDEEALAVLSSAPSGTQVIALEQRDRLIPANDEHALQRSVAVAPYASSSGASEDRHVPHS